MSFPAPPEGPPPKGAWRVTVEVSHLQLRPTAIATDGNGIYIAGAVTTPDDFRSRRWVVAKLDNSGAIAWSTIDELPRSPAPERVLLAGSAVVAAGQDGKEETSRLLMIAKYEASSGKRTWQRRFTARDPKCGAPDCAGKDAFGGLAIRGSAVVYSGTVDHPVEVAHGELSIAKGAPVKGYATRGDLRVHDIAADDSGIYLLEENLSAVFSLTKLSAEKTAWKQTITSGATRIGLGAGGVLAWGKKIEKRAADTGEVVWTSKLAAQRIEVAVDATGIYAAVTLEDKPAIAKLDPATGDVQWLRKLEGGAASYVAIDKDWLYVVGFDADKWLVERRRKSDGAIGEVPTTARTLKPKRK